MLQTLPLPCVLHCLRCFTHCLCALRVLSFPMGGNNAFGALLSDGLSSIGSIGGIGGGGSIGGDKRQSFHLNNLLITHFSTKTLEQ